jgi:uncharacterized protein DUF3854
MTSCAVCTAFDDAERAALEGRPMPGHELSGCTCEPEPAPLSGEHITLLAERGIPLAIAEGAGLMSVDAAFASQMLGYTSCGHGGLAIPYPGIEPTYHRIRMDGGERRYLCPKGRPVPVYMPPPASGAACPSDLAGVLVVVEAPLKALAMRAAGLEAVGLGGVATTLEKGRPWRLGKSWTAVALAGRDVRVLFDAGRALNPDVRRAEDHIVTALRSAGARVSVCALPLRDGADQGPDDFYAREGAEALYAVVRAAKGEAAEMGDERDGLENEGEAHVNASVAPSGETRRGNRREVRYHPGDFGPQVRTTLDELEQRAATYVNGGRLVHIVAITAKQQERSKWIDTHGKTRFGVHAGSPQIVPIGRSSLKVAISDACAFLKFVKREGAWVPCSPPDDIVGAVFEGPWLSMPRVVGIAETPILRPDGTILQTPGYDPQSGYWYSPSAEFPAVPDRPSQADASRAYTELADLFCDFPYADKAMAAIPVANALTVLARAYLVGEAAPGFVYDASTGGVGKTLQTDVISILATGRPASRKAYPASDEECEKVFAAYALRGASLISIDDIKRPLGGENLDRILTTRDEVDFRKLGETALITSPWRAVVMFTGCNIAFFGQMARRVLVSRIESQRERPQDRDDFKHPHLVEWVTEHRQRLVVALLTMLRAYVVAGCPDTGGVQWGSFEGWSRFVPHVIKFAGGPDVIALRAPEDADVERESLAAILEGLRALIATRAPSAGCGMTAAEIGEGLFDPTWNDSGDPGGTIRGAKDALAEAAGAHAHSTPTAGQVASYLAKHKGRPVRAGGLLLTLKYLRDPRERGANRWLVEVGR